MLTFENISCFVVGTLGVEFSSLLALALRLDVVLDSARLLTTTSAVTILDVRKWGQCQQKFRLAQQQGSGCDASARIDSRVTLPSAAALALARVRRGAVSMMMS